MYTRTTGKSRRTARIAPAYIHVTDRVDGGFLYHHQYRIGSNLAKRRNRQAHKRARVANRRIRDDIV